MTTFHYSSYWGHWSLVLQEMGTDGASESVEVDLTPINGDGWRAIARRNVRCHSTVRDRRDRVQSELPPDVRALMVTNIGEANTAFLLATVLANVRRT